jgi:Helix-turn-helix domain
MSNEQPFLPQAIGARLRALRTEAGWTQDNVATLARTLGLDWVQSTVAAIEAGDRALTLEEFFCLPVVYPTLGALVNLFSDDSEHDRWVELRLSERSGWVTPESHLRKSLHGLEPVELMPARLHRSGSATGTQRVTGTTTGRKTSEAPEDEQAAEAEVATGTGTAFDATVSVAPGPPAVIKRRPIPFPPIRRGRVLPVPETHTRMVGEWDPRAERVYLELPGNIQQRRSEIEVAAKGNAERKAARKFGVSAELVSVVAFKRYHQSLTDERDMRGAEAMPEDTASRTLEDLARTTQALRGHVTRTLLAEMQPMIDYYQGVA